MLLLPCRYQDRHGASGVIGSARSGLDSQNGNILGLQALWTLGDRKLNSLPLFQRPIALRLDRRKMDEDILAALPLDKPVSL